MFARTKPCRAGPPTASADRPPSSFRRPPRTSRRRYATATTAGVPWFALGLGSNLLFPDAGLDALVIRIGKGLDQITQRNDEWVLGAGMPAPLAAKRTAAAGWGGIHKMVGVPGSVGGGVVMNAGCHGAEWRDVVQSVHTVDAQGNDHLVDAAEAGFSYRRSDLGHVVVVSTTVEAARRRTPRCWRTKPSHSTGGARKGRRSTSRAADRCSRTRRYRSRNPALPRTSGQFIEADRPQGTSGRRCRSLADARELLRQHRRGHGGGRSGIDADQCGAGCATSGASRWSRR